MTTLLKFTTGVLLAAGLLAPMQAHAQLRDQNFRLGVQTNADNARARAMEIFANAVKAKSGGKMNVQIFYGGALGGDLQTVSAMRGGTVDGTVTATSTLVGLVKEFSLIDLPFVFQSNAEAMAVIDSPFGKRLNDQLGDRGLVALGYWGQGYRHLSNNRRPIKTAEDIKGLKIRVLQNPLYIDLWKALGANAVPMPFPEVYSALEQGTVDGQENPAQALVTMKFHEVQKYLSLTQHIFFVDAFLFSKPTWSKLNDDERKVIGDAATEAVQYGRVEVIAEDQKNIDAMRQKMAVNDIAPAELDRFRAAVKPVFDKYAAASDTAVVKAMLDTIARLRTK